MIPRRLRAVWVSAVLLAAAAGALALGAPAERTGPPPATAEPADRFPTAGASYLLELDGRALWARNPGVPLAPASLTKLLTALLAAEAQAMSGPGGELWVKVGQSASAATGSRLGLRLGDELRLRDLVVATLVSSSNDACLALAEHLGGDARRFVARMNARAAELGLRGSHFEDPCGHDRPGHVATAHDLALLARAVLARPELRALVAVERTEVVSRAGRRFAVRTHNAILGRLDGARGVKTGFTERAGSCLVALVQRGEHEVLLVLLDAPDRWWTASALVEEAFAVASSPASIPHASLRK